MLPIAGMALGMLGGGGGGANPMSATSSAESGTGAVTVGGLTVGSNSNTPQLLMVGVVAVVAVAVLARRR